jgi:hypothetical protein
VKERDLSLEALGVAQSNYEKVCSTDFELNTIHDEVEKWYEKYAQNVLAVKNAVNDGWSKVSGDRPFYTSAGIPLPKEVETFYGYFKTYC